MMMFFSDPRLLQVNIETREIIKPGHWGSSYQAFRVAGTLGTSDKSVEAVFPDGTVFNRRNHGRRSGAQEQGHGYAERILTDRWARPVRMAPWREPGQVDCGESPRRYRGRAVQAPPASSSTPSPWAWTRARTARGCLIAQGRRRRITPRTRRRTSGQLEFDLFGPGAVDWEAA